MYIEQKQNKIFRLQSNTTLSAEETNQVTTEFNNQIIAGGLTPSASSLTQLRDSIKNVVDTSANNLQEQIDAITSASDVFDVVGTYAQLQAYDKSTVPLNDIVKVLQDSTHNNAATYYRLVDASGDTEWQYIGQEGPYYTKSEIDTDFALKSQLPNIATTQQVGLVKPDGSTTFVGADGTISVGNNIAAALPLFTPVWTDYIMNNASYLRADTFSWQSGSVYTNAYNHLVNDIAGVTASTETIGGTTITYYQADDGHKVVLADQETNVQSIYTATGVAWYYILDTANVRFKLPRTQYNFTGYRDTVGNYVEESLPNIKGDPTFGDDNSSNVMIKAWDPTGCFVAKAVSNTMNSDGVAGAGNTATFDASASSSTYQDDAPVQQRATQMYLYFYIGNFSQSATEQTAGLNLELFNSKMDVDGSNATEPLVHFSDFEAFKNLILKETSNMLGRLDYANAEEVTIPNTGSPSSYTVPSDGYIISFTPINNAAVFTINSKTVLGAGSGTAARATNVFLPVSKNDVLTRSVNYGATFTFVPQKQIEESGS